MTDEEPKRYESAALQLWFGLSYASFLTLPRVLMEAMPFEWQDKMAALLNEYEEAFPNQPDIGTLVTITDARGKFIKCPPWLVNYRHPDRGKINELRKFGPPAVSPDEVAGHKDDKDAKRVKERFRHE